MSIYNERVKGIHDPVIASLAELGVQDKERITLNSSLDQTDFYQSNHPRISSRNGYNTSLSFSKTNINVGIGFPKSITFGDSYSIHHGSSFAQVATYAANNTASFTVGDSKTTTHARNNWFTQYKGKYSIQKGKEHKSKKISHMDVQVKLGLQGISYQKYTQNRTSVDASLFQLSLNMGIIKYERRLFRLSTCLFNMNMKNYLASSSMIHMFLSGISDNACGKHLTAKVYAGSYSLAASCAALYANRSVGVEVNEYQVRTTKSHAVFAKINTKNEIVGKLNLTNDRIVFG
jgi:hypothetical protein